MVLFPPEKGGGEGVNYGHKGKGILRSSLTDADDMPVGAITTSANGGMGSKSCPYWLKSD